MQDMVRIPHPALSSQFRTHPARHGCLKPAMQGPTRIARTSFITRVVAKRQQGIDKRALRRRKQHLDDGFAAGIARLVDVLFHAPNLVRMP